MCKYISIIFCSSSFLWSCHHFFLWPEDDPSNTEVMFTLKYSWMWYWVKGCCRKSFQLPFLSAKSTTVITFFYIHTHTYKYIYIYILFKLVAISRATSQHKHCSTNIKVFDPNLKHKSQSPELPATEWCFIFFHRFQFLVFLIFQIAGLTCTKKRARERQRNTPCVTRKQGRRGDVYYCHYVCQVFTRWQCSVAILLDKFYHTWNHFRNFLGPPFSLFLSLSVSVSPWVCLCR